MRILSGRYKGRQLQVPRGIRPTQDNVKKALFDILGDPGGCSFLELCAGSGAVGLEALSLGAGEVVFVEPHRACLKALRANINAVAPERCRICPRRAESAVKQFFRQKKRFDLVFCDPPYYEELAKKALQTLGLYDIVAPAGLVIAQHFKKDQLPERAGMLELFRQNYYGDTVLTFYRHG
ncbi:MAG: 16S rRNA (guanine(966)-N(2))-methyltransferase RsmD [Candidatus Omnitrophica bacterium]|nr:16S rRNA (guanine(966)-N(2))-methyltransferase RsmD [Candidatus Omnitrophota bacterium]